MKVASIPDLEEIRQILKERTRAVEGSLDTPCLLWTGSKSASGYPTMRRCGQNVNVRRLVYELLVGEVPYGAVIKSDCGPSCLNKDHLYIDTTRRKGGRPLRGETPYRRPR